MALLSNSYNYNYNVASATQNNLGNDLPVVYNIPDHLNGDTWNGINTIAITKNGSPINLLSASVLMQFKKHNDAPVGLQLSTDDNTIFIVDPINAIIQIPPLVVNMIPGTYVYDMQVTYYETLTSTSPTVKTYLKGSWNILSDTTNN